MNNDNQLRNSPPLKLTTNEKKSGNEGILEWLARNAKALSLLGLFVISIISGVWWLSSQFDKVNSKTNELRVEMSNELKDQTTLTNELRVEMSNELKDQTMLIRDNKQELSVLTERVSNIQEDVEVIRSKVDSGLDQASYLP